MNYNRSVFAVQNNSADKNFANISEKFEKKLSLVNYWKLEMEV